MTTSISPELSLSGIEGVIVNGKLYLIGGRDEVGVVNQTLTLSNLQSVGNTN
jgi:hypothetical protein